MLTSQYAEFIIFDAPNTKPERFVCWISLKKYLQYIDSKGILDEEKNRSKYMYNDAFYDSVKRV